MTRCSATLKRLKTAQQLISEIEKIKAFLLEVQEESNNLFAIDEKDAAILEYRKRAAEIAEEISNSREVFRDLYYCCFSPELDLQSYIQILKR